mmetsp:Transcript_47503/g.92778  ORF Transcript_47503/g.92778 Transcript_47503/m.92778 type:complete len:155 (-) Transcript_47503:401-865(-)
MASTRAAAERGRIEDQKEESGDVCRPPFRPSSLSEISPLSDRVRCVRGADTREPARPPARVSASYGPPSDRPSSSFSVVSAATISADARALSSAYLENNACWRPSQIVPRSVVTASQIGWTLVRSFATSAPGKTRSTQSRAVSNSWAPPSQLRL